MGLHFFNYRRHVGALVLATAAIAAPAAHADHGTDESVTVPLPGAGGFEFCVGTVDPAGQTTQFGRCDDSGFLQEGELTLTVSGTSTHSETQIDRSPDGCAGTGVEITRTAVPFNATATARIMGTTPDGTSVDESTEELRTANIGGSGTFARACLTQVADPLPEEDPSVQPPQQQPVDEQPAPNQAPASEQRQSTPAPEQQPQPGPQPAPETADEPAEVSEKPFTTGLDIRRQRMRSVFKRGFRLGLTCSAACAVDANLVLRARDAARYRVARSSTTLGRSTAKLASAGTRNLVIRVRRTAARKLANARSIKAIMRVLVTDRDGYTHVLKRTITLKR